MTCHDIYLVEAEAESDMQQHVETEIRHHQPKIPALSASPDAGYEQQHDDRLYDIIKGISVVDEHRAVAQFILQHVILMQLDRFAHQVLYDRQGSGTGGIGPVHEFTFHDRCTLLRSYFLSGFIACQLLCLLYAVVLGFLGNFFRRNDLQTSLDGIFCQRILYLFELCHTLLSGFLFGSLLGFHLLPCHLDRPYEGAVFPSGETP